MKPINIEKILTEIEESTGGKFQDYDGVIGDRTKCVPKEKLLTIVDLLLESLDYCHLSAITVQQRQDKKEELEVFYNFWSGTGFSLLIKLPIRSAKIPSLITMIPGADFYEREAAEMFGIEFTGREETPPLLLPDEWEHGPPFIYKEVQDE